MKHNVPIRKIDTFISEDGRRIDKCILHTTVDTDINTDEEIEFNNEEVLFVGYEPMDELIDSPYSEKERVKFPISGAKTIEDAFDKYIDIWLQVDKFLDK